jgi:hypothetical protein
MRKPNAIIHMALWGTAGGIATALVYLSLLITVFGADFELWRIFVLASLYGGVPGVVLGVIDGMIVQATMNDNSRRDLDLKRKTAETKVGLITFFGMLLFLGIAISPMLFIYLYVSFIPALFAMATAAYATKRYFMRVAELNGLKAKLDQNRQQNRRIERLALRVSEQRQALSNDFVNAQRGQHRR